jgi:hypothetical protein
VIVPTTMQSTPKESRRALYHHALADLIAECARGIAPAQDGLVDARAMRRLQQNLHEFMATGNAPDDVQFAAFFVDMMIADAFKNIFGDQIWSEEIENAGRKLCVLFSNSLDDLSRALTEEDEAAQFGCFKNLVIQYLAEVRRLNEIWYHRQITRGHS